MMARVVTKIGDVFEVKLDGVGKKYFQLIAFDLTMLNSDVIRAFKEVYADDAAPEIADIIHGEVDFYAHCVTRFGVKMGLWRKVGSSPDVGNPSEIVFREATDYGKKVGDPPLHVSHNWRIWRINESFQDVEILPPKYWSAYIGLVYPPSGIVEMIKGNKLPINYPDFK